MGNVISFWHIDICWHGGCHWRIFREYLQLSLKVFTDANVRCRFLYMLRVLSVFYLRNVLNGNILDAFCTSNIVVCVARVNAFVLVQYQEWIKFIVVLRVIRWRECIRHVIFRTHITVEIIRICSCFTVLGPWCWSLMTEISLYLGPDLLWVCWYNLSAYVRRLNST
jgi:hypothetical protein